MLADPHIKRMPSFRLPLTPPCAALPTNRLPETDASGQYADALLKLFLAEGLYAGHDAFVASADADPAALLQVRPPAAW